MDLNRATIVGRLTQDPEARNTASGIPVTSFSVATNFVWNDQDGNKKESVEYHNVVAWRKLGEIIAQYLRKGSRVLIEGRLQTRSWEGQDGVKRYRTEIVADNMIMLDSPGGGNRNTAQPQENKQENKSEQQVEEIDVEADVKKDDKPSSDKDINVEDIPF